MYLERTTEGTLAKRNSKSREGSAVSSERCYIFRAKCGQTFRKIRVPQKNQLENVLHYLHYYEATVRICYLLIQRIEALVLKIKCETISRHSSTRRNYNEHSDSILELILPDDSL